MSLLEDRVRKKQLEVKIIWFKDSNSSVTSCYSVTFNQVDLNFLATWLLMKSCRRTSAWRIALGRIGPGCYFSALHTRDLVSLPFPHLSCCHEQGSIPEMSHSHTTLSFHSALHIRGDLPNKPIESHTGYTQRGGAYTTGTRRVIIRHEVPSHWRRPQMKGWVLVSSQAAAVVACV